ncbi:hypothetical protein GCM10007860_28610 [Chitiniphilus shinanonensis]|uniref:Lipoprotein n=1 Tax=Chitiniphilus shinanonensis TaxID=553088 RepID=A0ABQ6BW30_9NEIS|nr:hypothetical protein [Chitiniphilus shinanonensis]GLS05704.1 hypothetical protein GCM10007860_28610 [Chitiniphilus shinanonensis]
MSCRPLFILAALAASGLSCAAPPAPAEALPGRWLSETCAAVPPRAAPDGPAWARNELRFTAPDRLDASVHHYRDAACTQPQGDPLPAAALRYLQRSNVIFHVQGDIGGQPLDRQLAYRIDGDRLCLSGAVALKGYALGILQSGATEVETDSCLRRQPD